MMAVSRVVKVRLIPTGSSIAESHQHSNVVKVELGRTGTGQPAAVEMIQDYTGSCLDPEYYFRWVPTYSCLLDSTAVELLVAGGISPFAWTITEGYFRLKKGATTDRSNSVRMTIFRVCQQDVLIELDGTFIEQNSAYTPPTSLTLGESAIVTVEDACGISVSGNVMNCRIPQNFDPMPDITGSLVLQTVSALVASFSLPAMENFPSLVSVTTLFDPTPVIVAIDLTALSMPGIVGRVRRVRIPTMPTIEGSAFLGTIERPDILEVLAMPTISTNATLS